MLTEINVVNDGAALNLSKQIKREVKSGIPKLITTRNKISSPTCFLGDEHA